MAKSSFRRIVMMKFVAVFLVCLSCVEGVTDPTDVQALEVLYSSLNNAAQLTNWKSNAGDPCGESWRGVICQGTAVISIQLPGLGLNGTLGYLLESFMSLKTLDLSGNNIRDTLPYQLPPNLTSLNFANNNLSGGLPYSIAVMFNLTYMNLSRNMLSQNLGDIFYNLTSLATLDLSHNNFTGDLPNSITSLSNISTFHAQNNRLTGSLSALSNLPLTNLNIANNNFTGLIPRELLSVPAFIYDGNSFENGQPQHTPPPPLRSNNRGHSPSSVPTASNVQLSRTSNRKKLSIGVILGIILGSVLLILLGCLTLFFCLRKRVKSEKGHQISVKRHPISVNTEMEERWEKVKPTEENMFELQKHGSKKSVGSAITSISYTVAALQTATNSFSQENIIGEGSLGRVYKAEFPREKIMAIKKIDDAALSLQDEDDFLENISNMSRLRHPNIVMLTGYCVEHGQRLLVYEYIANGSLKDFLHFENERNKSLTWNARVRVALGTARALEYLHEVCMPCVVHKNFKSANILLDEELNPHLSDCGVASLTPNTQREVSGQMVGSFGYSAPEFALSGIYTVKSDVYSFGVVMLELLTGRKPLDGSRVRSEQSLVRWATPQLHDIDLLAKMVDPSLNGMYPAKSLSRFADVIALCVQPEPEFRPPMSEVVQALVLLVQRASMANRRSSEDSGFTYRTPDHDMAY